ncbi:MAG TPA: hypothetical protein VFF53_12505 [Geobacteraceae bacterium]|nr:hypothetical protein [Geobacteraceae bacterium]
MALVNDVKKEINAKIIYVGPKGSGKTTALRYIYRKIKPECRSELKSSQLGDHQLVFFDFAYPQTVGPGGYTIRFHLYTILIGDGSTPPWRMLLKGADGLVFMADSAPERLEDNIASCSQLYEALSHYGIGTESIPVSIQCNKRDLAEVLPLGQIVADTFPELTGSVMPVTALTGEGVLDGLQKVVRAILQNLGQPASGTAEEANEELTVAEKPAEAVSPASAGVSATGFSVESAGEPVMLETGILSVPLRLLDAAGACKAEFSLGITIMS